jgi:hypothetical protein
LEELNKYDCNADRRLLCLFGTVFDVTSSEKGYGKAGACKFPKSRYGTWRFEFLLVSSDNVLVLFAATHIADKEYAGVSFVRGFEDIFVYRQQPEQLVCCFFFFFSMTSPWPLE